MRPLVFRESGRLILVKYKSDGTLSFEPDQMVLANGTVQSIAPNVNFSVTELPDGNSLFPMGRYDTGINGQLVVTMSSFQPKLYAALIGTDVEEEATGTLWVADYAETIPDESPYTITLAHTPKAGGALFIADVNGDLFDEAETTPVAGEYTISDNVLTFNEADAGKTVFISYEWTGTTKKYGIRTSGSRPVLHAIISGNAVDEDEINTYPVNIFIDKCKASDDIKPPTMQNTPEAWSFTLSVLRPRPGRRPVDWKFAIADATGSPGTP